MHFILKISAYLFGDLELTLSAQLSFQKIRIQYYCPDCTSKRHIWGLTGEDDMLPFFSVLLI
jgi:hypothetical protein